MRQGKDGKNPQWGVGSTRKAFYRDFRVPGIMNVNTDDHSVGVKAEYTDCKNLDPIKKSVTRK